MKLLGVILLLLWSFPLAQARFQKAKRENLFQSPRQVVEYFIKRDAQGSFVQMISKKEREAFTTWRESPKNDSYATVKGYEFLSTKIKGPKARVQILYDLVDHRDMSGTRRAVKRKKTVNFWLKKDQAGWRIFSPNEVQFIPHVSLSSVR